MKAVAFKIRLNSLYSIRIPYTWQSALTYPILPPSAIIGMLANALQRFKNDAPPLDYLKKVEDNVIWAGARLVSPAIVKSYTTSAITKWEVKFGGKSTNALGRQFAFTRNVEVVTVIKNDTSAQELIDALKIVPITCGDSESIATIEKISHILRTEEQEAKEELKTKFPIIFDLQKIKVVEGVGRLYLVHERCEKKGEKFPLVNYLFPLKEEDGVLFPTEFTIRGKQPIHILEIEDIGKVVKTI